MLGKCIKNVNLWLQRNRAAAFMLFLSVFTMTSAPVVAQDVSDVANNVARSANDLPGLISAFCYVLGLIFGIRGVLKLKSHVENPGDGAGQTPLRTPMISFFVGGGFFALPIILQAALGAIGDGVLGNFAGLGQEAASTSGIGGPDLDTNEVLNNIITSISDLPGLVTVASYLLGLTSIVMALLKVKEHVENPEQTKLQESVIRFLAGGALLAIPTIFNAMFATISGADDASSIIGSAFSGFFGTDFAAAGGTFCVATSGTDASMGNTICSIISHTGLFPAFLTAVSYLFGLVMGVWGILKIRDHVLNPQQTNIFEGVTRLLAGGAFFALPMLVTVLQNTFDSGALGAENAVGNFRFDGTFASLASSLVGGGACPTGAGLGLDGVLVCFATDILGPVNALLTFFAFVSGIVFIMIGVSRLIKGAQDGARGPGGIGTIMTFAMGGALISYNEIMRAASTTVAGSATTATYADMQYTNGMSTAEQDAAHAVISSILKFMIIVGLISFVRGLFIVRSVAEGNQQASMMAAVTHIVGGALAVNLGPVLNAVQNTLGTSGYGITFS